MDLDNANRWRDLWKRAAKRTRMHHKNALVSLHNSIRRNVELQDAIRELAEENYTLRAEKALLQAKIDVLVELEEQHLLHMDELTGKRYG